MGGGEQPPVGVAYLKWGDRYPLSISCQQVSPSFLFRFFEFSAEPPIFAFFLRHSGHRRGLLNFRSL